jgi:hypothetical protein
MNLASLFRGTLYSGGFLASLSVAMQYVSFDPIACALGAEGGCILDVSPFDVKVALTATFTMVTNAVAGLALWRGWGRK